MTAGSLQLVATPIGNLGDITERAVNALKTADVIACEDTRHTRKLLSHLEITGKELVSMHQHNEDEVSERLIETVRHGKHVVVVSDAGMPAISDPGFRLVRAAIDQNIGVDVLPGPSALLMAVVLSGFDTSRFVFEGFLPNKQKDVRARCEAIAHEERTVIIYEAPHRIKESIDELREACTGDRQVVLARELTKLHQEVWRGTLAEASELFDSDEPRGEFVIVLSGASPQHHEISDDDISSALRDHLDRGMTTKDAVKEVSEHLAVPKRRVYAIATK
jgi:16S rRNA (cytidine1402-2'-O)-methyltransferase